MNIRKVSFIGISVLLCLNLFAAIFLIRNIAFTNKLLSQDKQLGKLLTEEEAADYLNISVQELKHIADKDEAQRQKFDSYTPYQFIPYLKINSQRYYMKQELDKWVEHNVDSNSSY